MKKMQFTQRPKALLALLAVFAFLAATLAGCGGNGANSNDIHVLSREDGSGTRSAFVELFGVEAQDSSGEKVDRTIDTAEITNNTAVMMVTVQGDAKAIGYISLGSLNGSVKALPIGGVAASAATVRDNSYPICRPFNVVTKGDPLQVLSPAANDFYLYIISSNAKAEVDGNGYVSMDSSAEYESKGAAGKVTVSGSSSVSPLMEKLIEAYNKINPNVSVELQTSDSSTGISDTLSGACDIGMASRALKEGELSQGAAETTIAMDGIAVIVNPANTIAGLTKEQVRDIYTGDITSWDELG
ncbi:MAG: substrate-binding domain-containing protein [Oscillospiraceae bacterium]|nr:substrate-binding domain-containing protein [Oscillospiraceae bacterium]